MTFINGKTTTNLIADRGGSIVIDDEVVNLNDVAFVNNSVALTRGGAIAIQGAGQLSVSQGEFTGNSASANLTGGAIFAGTALHKMTFQDTVFTGNTNIGTGGAVYSANGTLTVSRSAFINNSGTGAGGAIRTAASALTITDSTFSGNNAGGSGGAVYMSGATPAPGNVRISNSSFAFNFTFNSGGAIALASSFTGTVELFSSTVSGNRSDSTSTT